jgi:hypothetical protein
MEVKRRTSSRETSREASKGKGRPRMDNQPTWMSVPPKNGERQHKTVEGKDCYHWCPNHNRWTRHRPSECKGIGFKAPIMMDQGNKFTNSNKPNMRLSKALAAISDEDDE